MMAPYPHDKADPPPRFFVSGGPAKSDNRLTGDGPCSVCGCQEWYKRADDYDPPEGWVCMVCHPTPSGVLVTPKHKGD
ncbi:hypothetical protein [Acetobacter sp. DsW_059]|uniref:hypothetical protein n=1 Tax=Acetobacter sp. DsW_059 TaxID=1670661 RepID=UPI00117759F4|nr:hypothetical protein [Acetobacter sp. DsW_059]